MTASKVVFFGLGPHGVEGIDVLASVGDGTAMVVVPSNREGPAVDHVIAAATRKGLPIARQPRRTGIASFVSYLRSLAPDVFVVWSYSMMIPQAVLDIPPLGTVNVHTGLLPEYRGGHVLQWALLNGERETGVTLHYMDAGVDTGPVIAERRFPIAAEDDALSVKEALKATGSALLREWWPRIANGTAPRTPQDESRARHWRLRTPEEGRIDLTRPAAEICRLVRALNSNDPGAYIEVGGRRISIVHAQPLPVASGATGGVLSAGDGGILVTEARIDGRPLEPSELSHLRDRVSQHQSAR